MPFKLAIIGLGKIAQDQHLPVVAKNRDFELAAVVSSRGAYRDVPSFKTPAELFAAGLKLDAVSLCMPPEPRFDIARDALDAGLHVLMEKPPTPTVGELDAITEHAERRKRILFTTWHSQYNAAVDEARRLLAGKTVTKLHVSWKEDVRHWHPGQEWIWEPGGFGVFDPGINAFSIVTKILPQPIFVSACTLETPSNTPDADCRPDPLQAVMGGGRRPFGRPRLAADGRAVLEHRRRPPPTASTLSCARAAPSSM